MSAVGSQFFAVFFLLNRLLMVKIHPLSDPLQWTCSGFPAATSDLFRKPPEAHVILKIVPKAGYECTQENQPMTAKESRDRKLTWVSEQYLDVVSAF
jgi:hypothetical protein